MLSLSTLSAMRDPTLYSDSNTFDIKRIDDPRKHVVLGIGAPPLIRGSGGIRTVEDTWVCWPRRGSMGVIST